MTPQANKITFSRPTENDIPFLVEAIFSAVKSGSNLLSYATLFEKSEEELIPFFKTMFEEDIEGQELSLSGFLIAKDANGLPAATCNMWIEGEEGPSSMLTAQLLSYTLGNDIYQKALNKKEIIESLRVDREEGALQIEHVYTPAQFRGKGLAAQVIREQIKNHHQRNPALEKVQVILFKTNENALKAYTKMGFEIKHEQHSTHPDILTYFPSDTRVLMEASVERLLG